MSSSLRLRPALVLGGIQGGVCAVLLPGLLACVMYVIIAFATGASAGASIAGSSQLRVWVGVGASLPG